MKPSQIFSHWNQIRRGLLVTIDQFNDKEFSFTPFKDSWPAGQIMLHIADCEDNWLHGVVRQEIRPWVFYPFSEHPTRAKIKDLLNRAHERTVAFLENLEETNLERIYKTPEGESFPLRWIIWHVLEHEIHHRGELSLILGMLGREGLDV